MDIGVAIAVFLTLSLLLLALFCFTTKYFHHKQKLAKEENIQIYSMVDDVNTNSIAGISNEYDDYNQKEEDNKKFKETKKNNIFIEMSDMKSPLISSNEGIISNRRLLRRLNGEGIPTAHKQQSARSMHQLKMFQPDKLITTTRKGRIKEEQHEQEDNQKEKPSLKHTFISKLICYDTLGIHIIDVIMISIKKTLDENIKQTKKIKLSQISNNNENFENQLEILGFQLDQYICYKYESTVELNDLKPNEDYMIKNLKTSQTKEMIQIEEYIILKHKLESL